jgi:Transposase DDE domain
VAVRAYGGCGSYLFLAFHGGFCVSFSRCWESAVVVDADSRSARATRTTPSVSGHAGRDCLWAADWGKGLPGHCSVGACPESVGLAVVGVHAQAPLRQLFPRLVAGLASGIARSGLLRKWVEGLLPEPLADEIRGTAIDGKTLCTTLAGQERNVHLLSLLDHSLGGVLSQQAVDPSTNEAKASLELLKTVMLKGRLVSGDAMFCQREICQQIVDSGGDYLFVVKDNQPQLKAAIEAEFQPGFSPRHRAAAATRTL